MTHSHELARGVEVGTLKACRDSVERGREAGAIGSAFFGELIAHEALGDWKGARILRDPIIPFVGKVRRFPAIDEKCRAALNAGQEPAGEFRWIGCRAADVAGELEKLRKICVWIGQGCL